MFQSFARSWELIKASYKVLRADPELMVLPVISMVGVIIVSIVFFVPLFFTGVLESATEDDPASRALGLAILFLFYLVMYTIIIFSNVALVGAALMRLRGEDPTVSDGLRIAQQHLGQIVGYAAISATVGVLLSLIRGDSDNIIGRIIAGIINFAWNVVTFLVIPVLVVENVGPIEAIKRSGRLLRRTWGEQIIANGGVGLVLGLVAAAVVLVIGGPLLLIGLSSQSTALIIFAAVLVILIVTLICLFGSALSGVFQATLYNYATTGNSGQFFDERLVRDAFKLKER